MIQNLKFSEKKCASCPTKLRQKEDILSQIMTKENYLKQVQKSVLLITDIYHLFD